MMRLLFMFGPGFLVVGVIFQIICAVHCVRNGRQQQWLWIILVFSVMGCLVYFFVEILPTLGRSSALRRTNQALTDILDPDRGLRTGSARLAISNNVQNTCQYAEQLARKGKYTEAINIYTEARKGMFQYDPLLLTGLARVYFSTRHFGECVTALRELLEHWPDQRRGDAHLLYAMALEEDGRHTEAEREYKLLADSYPGPEAKYRYARFLQKQGAATQARELYRDIVLVAQSAPKHYQRMHREWISAAQDALKGV